jgi:hypothetical protein
VKDSDEKEVKSRKISEKNEKAAKPEKEKTSSAGRDRSETTKAPRRKVEEKEIKEQKNQVSILTNFSSLFLTILKNNLECLF